MSTKYPGGIITSGANAGYSVSFTGSTDKIVTGTMTALGSDFTLECWIYTPSTFVNYNIIWDNRTSDPDSAGLLFTINSSGNLVFFTNNSFQITTTTVLKANTWYHVALVRSGSSSGNCKIYINGAADATTATYTTSFTRTTATIGNNWSGSGYNFNSYISNLRTVTTALYTATFNPPTQLLAVANTTLLTCNSPAIVDQSSSAVTLTVTGAKVSTFTPFQGYVAYNPALGAATPGIWSVSDAIQAAQTRRWNMYDPYFNLTTLLLHGNGTNGAQNNTFLDSSSNNFTITRNGNTTQGTFSPFSQTGWGNYFDGTGDYLSLSPSAIGTNNFTIEAWVYLNSNNNYYGIYSTMEASSGTGVFIGFQNTGVLQGVVGNGTTTGSANVQGSTAVTANAWHHVAFVRSGSSLTLYLDGLSIATGTSSGNITNANAVIGRFYPSTDNFYLPGYISNLRVLNGTALYSGSTYTVPTAPLTAITNTQVLTCQSNRFLDNSTNAYAITRNGDTSVQAFSPFYPLVAYTPQAQGGSGYFDGNGDYLTITNSSNLNPQTGDFTFEFWAYWFGTGTASSIFEGKSNGLGVGLQSGKMAVSYSYNAVLITDPSNFPKNTWTHVAATRSGTTLTLWINGVSVVSATNSTNFVTSTTNSIGWTQNTTTSDQYFDGYISGIRFLKGTAQYTTTFTPPTAPPTAVTNTQLLCNFTNAGITDATAKNVLETVGNAQISTTQSKFGGSSMYFDGTGDYLIIPSSQSVALGSGDWTVEGWFYFANVTGLKTLFDQNATTRFYLYLNGTTLTYYTSGAAQITGGTIAATTWYHIALVRSGGSTKLYLNGTQIGSSYTDSQNYGAANFYIGSYFGAADYMNGYIDDVRITKGYARYTANFTPQTSQWQDQ